MKMEISVLYALLRRMGFLKISIMKAVALHFGFGGWNERKFYPTTPKHKSIGTTSMFLQSTKASGFLTSFEFWRVQ